MKVKPEESDHIFRNLLGMLRPDKPVVEMWDHFFVFSANFSSAISMVLVAVH